MSHEPFEFRECKNKQVGYLVKAAQFTNSNKNRVFTECSSYQNNVYHGWEGEAFKSNPVLKIPTITEGKELVCKLGDYVLYVKGQEWERLCVMSKEEFERDFIMLTSDQKKAIALIRKSHNEISHFDDFDVLDFYERDVNILVEMRQQTRTETYNEAYNEGISDAIDKAGIHVFNEETKEIEKTVSAVRNWPTSYLINTKEIATLRKK